MKYKLTQNFIDGKIDDVAAVEAVRIDLLDTYQAQLNTSLADADQANMRGFGMRREHGHADQLYGPQFDSPLGGRGHRAADEQCACEPTVAQPVGH